MMMMIMAQGRGAAGGVDAQATGRVGGIAVLRIGLINLPWTITPCSWGWICQSRLDNPALLPGVSELAEAQTLHEKYGLALEAAKTKKEKAVSQRESFLLVACFPGPIGPRRLWAWGCNFDSFLRFL
jgi:hypothetical protein